MYSNYYTTLQRIKKLFLLIRHFNSTNVITVSKHRFKEGTRLYLLLFQLSNHLKDDLMVILCLTYVL